MGIIDITGLVLDGWHGSITPRSCGTRDALFRRILILSLGGTNGETDVVYSKSKHSTHPGPRAKSIDPAPSGDDYTCQVDKFWIVANASEDGNLLLYTRRGKTHVVAFDDPNLRRPTLWEHLLYGEKFPELPHESPASEIS